MLQEELPWKQLYEMAVVCCRHRKLRGFSEQLLGELEKLIPFDEAMILYLDGNQKLTDYYLYHIDPKWAYYMCFTILRQNRECTVTPGGSWTLRRM
jgi:hypothetical protein